MRKTALSAIILATVGWTASVSGAEKPVDRAQWYVGDNTTSDDLRRVPVPKGFGEPADVILIRNARLFDGTGAAAHPAQILIEHGHITRIAAGGELIAAPKDAQIIDAAGKTVMPGLIDLHTHLTYGEGGAATGADGEDDQASAALRGAERLRFFVESGVTAIRDVGSTGVTPFVLKEWVWAGRIPGPRVFPAGQLITGIGGHGTEGGGRTAPAHPEAAVYEANGPDGFRAAVRLQFKRGADLIKLGSHFSPEEVKAAVDEAHNLGLKVTVDAETIFTRMAVEAGVDCVEHPLPRSDETVKLMAAKGICSDMTLVPYQYINAGGGYMGSTSRRFTETNATTLAMAKKLQDAGVKIGIGTDLVVGWYRYLPDAYLQELRNYRLLDHTAAEALVTATRTNSEILGMADRLGTVQTGKLADLLIVDGKPDEALEDLKKLAVVIVNGRVVVRGGHVDLARHKQDKPPYSTAPAQ
ncbi:amidohydrolase family protein [Novosphingobium sp.]|uniref:amidohydrolase family protein n=1 Tax=Novosphingobium sp. TaxID=1874826 RepID=UPI0038BA4624